MEIRLTNIKINKKLKSFGCFNVEEYTKKLIEKREEIKLYKSIKKKTILKKYGFDYSVGFPDFFYIEDDKLIFVECKGKSSDGLRYTQLKWILEHNVVIRIIYIDYVQVFKLNESSKILFEENNTYTT